MKLNGRTFFVTVILPAIVLLAVSLLPASGADASECTRVIANTDAAVAICAGAERIISVAPDQTEPRAPDTFAFPSSSSTVVASGGFLDDDEVGWFWTAVRGDSVSETFSTSLPAVDRMILNIEVVQNVLNSGAFVDWDVVINGVVVASLTVEQGFIGPVTIDQSFAPIAGPSYRVQLVVTNVVASGQGSHTLAYAGDFAHSVELINSCDVDGDGDFDLRDVLAELKTNGLSAAIQLYRACKAQVSPHEQAQIERFLKNAR